MIIPISIIAIPFFISTPLLNYDVSEASLTEENELKISIYNLGLATAKNTIISVDADSKHLHFSNFTSVPALPPSNNYNGTQLQSAFFKIDVIPPASYTKVTSKVNGLESITKLTVYLRSDQWVGYHGLVILGAVYIAVTGVTIILLFPQIFVSRLLAAK